MTLAATATLSRGAAAQCCTGYSLATVCADTNLTKARWCIQNTVPSGQAALPKEFCTYGDQVISTLERTFNVAGDGVFEFELDAQTGGAHTGTACNNRGAGVAYDAFVGTAYGAKGFWGYLLSLHEAINVWTGMTSSGWPTDWWADHQSAFPNLMDFHVMTTLGTENNDQNLLKAAAAQKKRFYPGGDSADPKVVALDNVFAMMPNGDGFAGFSDMFARISGDGVRWDRLGVPNPDVKRSEYVVAYMSLAARQSVLATLQGPGANGGGDICNGVDNQAGDAPYVCSQPHIDQIATAHCSIAANSKPSQDLTRLRAGSYDAIPSGPCGATCPAECACDAANHCVAPWLGTQAAGGQGGAGGGTGSPTGGKASVAMGGKASVAMGGKASAAMGGTASAATGGTASAATGGVSSGAPGSGGTFASHGGALGAGGGPASSGGSGFAGSGEQEKSDSSCSCRAVGHDERFRGAGSALAAAAVLYLARSRRKRC